MQHHWRRTLSNKIILAEINPAKDFSLLSNKYFMKNMKQYADAVVFAQ